MTCIKGKDIEEVVQGLKDILKQKGGKLEEVRAGVNLKELCIVAGEDNNITIMYPKDFNYGEYYTKVLTEILNCTGFMFHIQDSNLWMYLLYSKGKVVDTFNPMPNYLKEKITFQDIEKWQGNPKVVCKYFTDLLEKDIKNYYKRWDMKILEDGLSAYENDYGSYGDEWQLLDFMSKLNFIYPINLENNQPIGKLYKIKLPME